MQYSAVPSGLASFAVFARIPSVSTFQRFNAATGGFWLDWRDFPAILSGRTCTKRRADTFDIVITVATNPLVEIRSGRAAKAETLRGMGLNPYPSRSKRTHFARTILDEFASLEGQTATVAGRLMSWRKQGALAFAHVQDQSGKLQLFLRRNLVQPTDAAEGRLGYAETNLLDLGDIIEATGKIVRTERGEISILVESLRLLTKAIRPLPDQWSGLKDREQVLRKRYLDTTLEPESFQRFGAIAKIVASIRAFLK
ncbi:MAG TPA: OB-fold nucleic acid binding domain-containing protein, partial [Candidatus Acidoferrales bacterium]|nr:OB-fold nucleic acid binding domain-containing protein [Candidatus Acidoferrales bacterium]